MTNTLNTVDTNPGNIYSKIVELIDSGKEPAAAAVLSVRGSTPQVAGARAIVEASGRLWGTIGGGAVEAKTLHTAAEACRTKRPCVFDFPLNNHDATVEAAVCGGQMRVLIDPTVGTHRSCFAAAASAVIERRRGCLLTTIRTGETAEGVGTAVLVEWLPEDSLDGGRDPSVNATIRSCLQSGRAGHLVMEHPAPSSSEQSLLELFIEPVIPQPLLVIAGAGHVGRAVAWEACRVGFDVTVIDDRPELASAELFPPEVHVACGPVPETLAACPLDEQSFVVLATRGHKHDSAALTVCIRRRLAYLGMIGSDRKVALVRKSFLESGRATAEEFDRVYAPIGVEIGAVTVAEIAVSIVAQLIAVRRKAVCP